MTFKRHVLLTLSLRFVLPLCFNKPMTFKRHVLLTLSLRFVLPLRTFSSVIMTEKLTLYVAHCSNKRDFEKEDKKKLLQQNGFDFLIDKDLSSYFFEVCS